MNIQIANTKGLILKQKFYATRFIQHATERTTSIHAGGSQKSLARGRFFANETAGSLTARKAIGHCY